jgi:histone H1/5
MVAAHPSSASMVKAAIKALKERKGSSLQAIKKYIAANYKCDIVKIARFINKALKAGVESGVYTKNKGSFKLSVKAKEEKPKAAKKPKAKKAKSPKKKSASPKKKAAAKPKKAKTPKKKVAAEKPTAAAAPKPAATKKPVAKKAAKKTSPKKKAAPKKK